MKNDPSVYEKRPVDLWKTTRRFGEKNWFTRNEVKNGVVHLSLNTESQ